MSDELPPLSESQVRVLDAIRTLWQMRGYPPSIQEIADECDFGSTQTAHFHVLALARLGYLRRKPNTTRSLTLVQTNGHCPLCGEPKGETT